MNSENDFFSCENFSSIFGENDMKYESSIDSSDMVSSILYQKPYPDNQEETAMPEQALPSMYILQPCNPSEVSAIISKIIYVFTNFYQ